MPDPGKSPDMTSSTRQSWDRFRHWLGWVNDDRLMEHDAQVDRARTSLRAAIRHAAVDDTDPPDPTGPHDAPGTPPS